MDAWRCAALLALSISTAALNGQPQPKTGIAASYGDTARKLIAAALHSTDGLSRLEYLSDRIGNRLSGSESLERAIEWAAGEMKNAGLKNVKTPPVRVPHWVRGKESAVLLAPVHKPLAILGFGMSVGTP